jgi:hypothetical protein
MKSFTEQIAEQQTGTATAMEPMRGPHLPGWNEVNTEHAMAGVASIAEPTPETLPVIAEIPEELLSVKDASRVMDCTYGLVYRLCEGGILKAKHVPSGGKKAFAIRKSDLERWLAKPGQRMKFKHIDWTRAE